MTFSSYPSFCFPSPSPPSKAHGGLVGFRRFADAPPPPSYPPHPQQQLPGGGVSGSGYHHPSSGSHNSDHHDVRSNRSSRSHSAEPSGSSKQSGVNRAGYAMSTTASQQRLAARSQSPATGRSSGSQHHHHSWTSAEYLPVVAPSAADLHAQLAMLDAAAHKRAVALATLKARAARGGRSRGQQVAKALTTGGGGGHSHSLETPSSRTAGPYHPTDNAAAEAYASAAVSRLEQGTKRLARQYEDLQRVVLKLSTVSDDRAKQPINHAPR